MKFPCWIRGRENDRASCLNRQFQSLFRMNVIHIQKFAERPEKFIFRHADVSRHADLFQGMPDSGDQPLRIVFSDAGICRNAVCHDKTDAVHIRRQPVRVGAQHFRGLDAVKRVDPVEISRADAETLHVQLEVAFFRTFPPGFPNGFNAFSAETRHLFQPCGSVVQHLQGFRTESFDNRPGIFCADAFDGARRQILFDAFQGCRQGKCTGIHPSLMESA